MRMCCEYHRLIGEGHRHLVTGFHRIGDDSCRGARPAPQKWIEQLERGGFVDPAEVLPKLGEPGEQP